MATATKKVTSTKSAKAATPKVAKPKAEKVLNPCGCGCGRMTSHRFAPGHDAKLKSQIFKVIYDKTSSKEQVSEAMVRLDTLGWTHLLSKDKAHKANVRREMLLRGEVETTDKPKAKRSRKARTFEEAVENIQEAAEEILDDIETID